MPERRTPLYDYHARHAELVKGGGDYQFPLSYGNAVDEHLNTRMNVGMQDLSTMGEIDVKGPGAERLLNRLLVNDIRDLLPGQVRYSTMVNPNGGIVDDVTVYKFNDEHWMLVTSSAPRKKSARWIMEHAVGMSAYATDLTGAVGLISVQGPRSRELMASTAQGMDLSKLRFFHFGRAEVFGVEILVSRSGYTGELGYELYVPAEEAHTVWEGLLKAGREFGLRPYGTAAMQSLRIEKGLPLAGPDIRDDENHTPFNLGLDRWIRFEKQDFIGRDALLRVQSHGLTERWVGMSLEGELAARASAPIYSVGDVALGARIITSGQRAGEPIPSERAGPVVGYVTSSAKGHSVGKVLALGFVQTSHTHAGCQLLVDVEGTLRLAKVVPTPFFDPAGIRLRGKTSLAP